MKTVKILTIVIVVLMATAAVAYGADQIRDRGAQPHHDQDPDKVQLQKRLQDGSCQDAATDSVLKVEDATDDAEPAKTRDRDRDQLRDGSCGECDGDGTCTQTQDCSRTQTQTQAHDGNAWDDGDAGHEGAGGQSDGDQGQGGQGDCGQGDCGNGGGSQGDRGNGGD